MDKNTPTRIIRSLFLVFAAATILTFPGCASNREAKRQAEIDATQKEFSWWPTDAQPSPVKDEKQDGYWWWPTQPGQSGPLWGNRGYIFMQKVIFDYKSDELPPAKPQEMRASLIIKKIVKNVKVYFDYNKTDIRPDAAKILIAAVGTLKRNPETDILITGNCDLRGSENYNEKLGRQRADAVKTYMIDNGVAESRIRIISRGKLDAVAPLTDLVGMQKDRNAQFMIAEVEEVMIPTPGNAAASTISSKETEVALSPDAEKVVAQEKEEIEGDVKVSTREYTIQKNDSLWKIAQKELGSGHRWKYLYEMNKDKIKNPNKLRVGTVITIPVE
jgi:outer membrane protein OmpA-like peptidoglycan-associated protein/LysM repeat protein